MDILQDKNMAINKLMSPIKIHPKEGLAGGYCATGSGIGTTYVSEHKLFRKTRQTPNKLLGLEPPEPKVYQ